MHTIAIANQKGGVGKTTTAVNLAAVYASGVRVKDRQRSMQKSQAPHTGLDELWKPRVLLVDYDPQSQASFCVGMRAPATDDAPSRLVVSGKKRLDEMVVTTPFGFDLLPANRDLADLEERLSRRGQLNALDEALAPYFGRWDIVLVDCPPAIGWITSSALYAANTVIVPMNLETLSLDSLDMLCESMDRVKVYRPGGCKIGAFVGTKSDPNTILAREVTAVLESLTELGPLAKTLIRRSTALAKAPAKGQPITCYDPKGHGTEDYRALADELVTMGVVQ
jgi:chromosome partitioning protein